MKYANQQETPYYESSRLPYVCWYQNDFLGGVRGMRAHEIGIYTILLNEMYARGRPLELSVKRLARLCGCDKRTFTNALEMLIEEGKILNLAGGLWNKRCENVFQERAKLLEQKSFAGRSSAKKRKEINAEIQQLRNESARDDEQNSEAQKGEEKETPNGVLEKNFFSFPTAKQEKISAHPSSPLPSTKPSPLPPSQQDVTENPPDANEGGESSHNSSKKTKSLLTTSANTQNATDSPSLSLPMANIENPAILQVSTKNTPETHSKTKSRKTISQGAIPKGHRLPSDWQADINAAVLEGLSEEQARWQEKKFRDYWHAKSGKEALKVDWQATWRNWFRREIERIKEQQEKLAIFSSHPSLTPRSSNDEALYRSLINYRIS
ncbi:YdaU family protein [Bartonella refiksaydamii]|uniref:YdaU family protein n=1 Tax=Bartonella refiksaydamii TaxID=2654951 RepID=UPI0012EB9D1E|nr:YdaU family protein [Bartonella refiksaydamii]